MTDAGVQHREGSEVEHLLEAVYQRYGYDFRRYEPTVMRRRVLRLAARLDTATLRDLRESVLRDEAVLRSLVEGLTIHVTDMFRDPPFWACFRREVVPVIRTYPTLKVWIAGCSSGEEAHSLAILLHEEGLLARSVLYATDV